MTTMSFEKWRAKFELAIRRKTPEGIALQKCTEYLRRPASQLPEWLRYLLSEDPGWPDDVHVAFLRLMYNMTLTTQPLRPFKEQEDAYARKALRDLTAQAESFVQHLKKTAQKDATAERVMITPDHHLFMALNLAPLLAAYQNAATLSRYFLDLLERPAYFRKPDVIDTSVGLLALLVDTIKVPEHQALELIYLALLAQGHPKSQLEDLRSPGKIRWGTFRKRKGANRQWHASFNSRLLRDPKTKEPTKLKSINLQEHPVRKK